jgi:D-tyrosyl-tRNA(Tyr) deacylase
MRAVIQKVKKASVIVDNVQIASIGKGILVFLGIKNGDTANDSEYLAKKICDLRIFENKEGKFDFSVRDIEGELLIVSQFTLYGECLNGRRPDFTQAAPPDKAAIIYEQAVKIFREQGLPVQQGRFQAMMEIELVNDGPVTLILESKN